MTVAWSLLLEATVFSDSALAFINNKVIVTSDCTYQGQIRLLGWHPHWVRGQIALGEFNLQSAASPLPRYIHSCLAASLSALSLVVNLLLFQFVRV